MPIYAYKCDSCGFAKDVLQKVSDPLLSECPSCGQSTFAKQLTAAGFQLKGSGWYATDFKGGGAGGAAVAAPAAATADAAAPSADTAAAPAKSAETPAASGGCGAACACHS
ncbi:zinc ribbon domain-containing protein [Rhodoferax sp. 4810]|nr:zinc ribbon domain-containing protein [Rhodoferax jenense]